MEKSKSFINDNKGISLIIVNTEKGKLLKEKVLSKLEYYNIDINDYLQPRLKEPNKRNEEVDIFWRDYLNNGFIYIVKKYGTITLFGRVKGKIKRIILKIIK